MKRPTVRERNALIDALRGCRFTIHCSLLGYRHRDDWEGIEVASEVLAESQKALRAVYEPDPPPPICSGCSPVEPFETAEEVAAWRAATGTAGGPSTIERGGRVKRDAKSASP